MAKSGIWYKEKIISGIATLIHWKFCGGRGGGILSSELSSVQICFTLETEAKKKNVTCCHTGCKCLN